MEKNTHLMTMKIGDKNITYNNQANGTQTLIYNILVKKKAPKRTSAYKIKDFHNIEEISLHYQNGKKINLPDNMKIKLLNYIKTQHDVNKIVLNNQHFDCVNFAHYLNGVEYVNNFFEINNWNFEKFIDLKQLKIGDTIISGIKNYKEKPEYTDNIHFSIYLGEGFFMGKSGSKGPVIVYDLKGLQEVYPYKENEIFKITPKKYKN